MRWFRLILAGWLLVPLPLEAQLEPPATGGLVALDQSLRMLGQYKRVLMIGAHPDDEDTELLTILVRGRGAEAAYLSLTRGEGGQNLIGDELGEELGLLRTEELLAARRLDGARQYFTRAYDFGYSKTLDDTWRHWPRDSVLKDVVRVVRRFRPQIIVSIFSGAPRDGHGQHQAAGWAAREAFRMAGDSTRFAELREEEGLTPWEPLKLYRSTRFDSAATTLVLDGGVLDPAVGKSFHQIAMAGRSLHRSQDMGQLQQIGPSTARLQLLEDRTGRGEGDLFARLDTTLAGVPQVVALGPGPRRAVEALLARYGLRLDSARAALAPPTRTRVGELLARAAADLEAARQALVGGDGAGAVRRMATDPVLGGDPFEEEFPRLGRALLRSLDLVADGVSEEARVIPGQPVAVTASLWNAGTRPVAAELCLGSVALRWSVQRDSAAQEEIPLSPRRGACLGYDAARGALRPSSRGSDSLPPGRLASARLAARVPAAMGYTVPYFLRLPRQGDLYQWDPAERWSWGLPFGDPPFTLEVQVPLGAAFARGVREISFRGNDQATGEFRLPVTVGPRVDVRLDPASEVWPRLPRRPRTFTVTLVHGGRDTVEGTVQLLVPPGWTPSPERPFRLTRRGERLTMDLTVRPPDSLRAGRYELAAVVTDRTGRRYDVGLRTVAHPHVRPRSYVRRAVAVVHVTDLALPRLRRVAYLRGAADQVPEALRSLGVPLELLDGARLDRLAPSRYDAVVIGPRAYETDSALRANNAHLLRYAREGGLVLVQYQQYGFFDGGYAPYPLTVGGRAPPAGGHDRVTDETAPVRVVDPASPVVRSPNRLGPGDWEGWVQERGLYFARTWDPAYRPVLEMNDPGEPPLRGGLLVARVGRGTWVYTGLSFFRQLPAGVPGAVRLFVNLLALGAPRVAERPAEPPRGER